MRLIAILVFLTVLVTPALAGRHQPPTPPGVNAGEGIPVMAAVNLHGASVFNRVPDGAVQGFTFEMRAEHLRPLVYPFVGRLGGVPTLDIRQANIFAEWGFTCFDPRETYGGIGYGSWRRDGGVRFSNEKFIVRTTVIFYEMNLEPPDPYDPYSEPRIARGRVIAGPFTGEGKANAATSWEAFLNNYGWTNGLNLQFGQQEWGDSRLQFQALAESFKKLKPATPILTPY